MSRFIVYINDSAGIHTPSHRFGSRRAAEVFAAQRSRFRRDCFVIVAAADDTKKRWIVAYRAGFLQDVQVGITDVFTPERVQIQVTGGATIYTLIHKEAA